MPAGRAEKSTVNSARSAQPNKRVLSGEVPVQGHRHGQKASFGGVLDEGRTRLGVGVTVLGFAGAGRVLIDQPDPQEPGTTGVQGQEPVLPLLHLDKGKNLAIDQHGVPEELRYT